MDVGSWLRNLGLGQYEPAFVANAIDSDVLAELTEVDFEKMGIPLGDRKRLMRAISAMVAGSPHAVTKTDIGEDAQNAPGAERRNPRRRALHETGSGDRYARAREVGGLHRTRRRPADGHFEYEEDRFGLDSR